MKHDIYDTFDIIGIIICLVMVIALIFVWFMPSNKNIDVCGEWKLTGVVINDERFPVEKGIILAYKKGIKTFSPGSVFSFKKDNTFKLIDHYGGATEYVTWVGTYEVHSNIIKLNDEGRFMEYSNNGELYFIINDCQFIFNKI